MAIPPVNRPKDPWPCVLSLPVAQDGFVVDPTLPARDNIKMAKVFYNKNLPPN